MVINSEINSNKSVLPFIEKKIIEYKEELNEKFEKVVVSFLNADGGAIYIGINASGKLVGIDKADEIAQICTNRLNDSISPSILGLYTVKILQDSGKHYIEIKIVVSS